MAEWDILIKDARVFDGLGGTPFSGDIAVAGGRIAALGPDLDTANAGKVVDAAGKWAMPGLLDIHTHYDLELEVAPGLPESLRHGTTTVVIANCSLGLAFGNQRRGGRDPIVDCYARVENVPKSVLSAVADKVTWTDPKAYLEHLETLRLGPNVVPLLPHSMLRIEVMGFDDSISRDPTPAELDAMAATLDDALEAGYAGLSTDALPFHYLANDPNRDKTIPTQFARYSELKRLTGVVRDRGLVWQATPPKDSPLGTIKTLLLTSGRLFGKPLKVTVVAALDVATNRNIIRLGRTLARLLNSRLVDGRFYLQALAAPFKVWSEGVLTPLSEEIPELRALVETDLEERDKRQQIMRDPVWVAAFRAMWMKGKDGFSLAAFRRRFRLEPYAMPRELDEMVVEKCPMEGWAGQSLAEIYARFRKFRKNGDAGACISLAEADLFVCFKGKVRDEADFLLMLLRTYDTDLYWHTTSANRDPALTRELIMDPLLLPGFNDSGAHLTNMAFYDCNLRALQMASEGGEGDVAYMVRRLTHDPASLFGLDTGQLAVGAVADIVLIDPDALAVYDAEAGVRSLFREEFDHHQLVNRSDGVVDTVIIGGKIAWEMGDFASSLGREKFGRLLRPCITEQPYSSAEAAE